jgi:hypothetical protein
MSIDKDEQKILADYFKNANIKIKTVDTEGNRSEYAETAKN